MVLALPLIVAACAPGTDAAPAAPASPGAAADAPPPASGAPAPDAAWPPQLREWADKARAQFAAPTLDAARLAALADDVLIVDVREPREIAVSGLPHAMPLASEAARREFVRKAAGETVVVYCTVGWRSAEYARQLADAGVTAFNLDGGLCAWAAAGRPVVDPAGHATTRLHAFSADFADCVPPGFTAVTE